MIGLALATQEKSLPEFDENGLYNTKASLSKCLAVNVSTCQSVKDTLVSCCVEARGLTGQIHFSSVICASHIAMQWASEIAKFTDLKVTQLTNITEASEVTYGDIIDSGKLINATVIVLTISNRLHYRVGESSEKQAVHVACTAQEQGGQLVCSQSVQSSGRKFATNLRSTLG